MVVKNQNIASIARRIARAKFELNKSGSSNQNEFELADIVRQESYLADLLGYLNYIVAQTPLDLPESRPDDFAVEDPVKYELMENEAGNDLMGMYDGLEQEVLNCVSASRYSGMNRFDEKRMRDAIAATQAFIANYIRVLTPIDYPESSPMRAGTGQGRSGVIQHS